MTLIKCPECGTEVEEGTVSCPKCGCSLEGIKLERKPAESPKQEPDLNELDALRKIQKSMEHIESMVHLFYNLAVISLVGIGLLFFIAIINLCTR
ncbi:zinc-ribbon domain-containing protein [Gallintestinimicrobium sp.]|jgi:hypothetical protein|uniref:zinc-ribbon domain-containing protein n=1 Tax=Gallintestinimicrobium sp. TaxID=2981655 RepID=UPI0039949C25